MLCRLRDTGNYREIFNYLENYTNYTAFDAEYYFSIIEYLKMCRQLSAVVILSRMKNYSDRSVKKAASKAIEYLKKEHNNDTDGWLSVPDSTPDSGTLSLHKVPGGELSVQEEV